MGTRHLIEVSLGGELKIAQYGQWDGYPTGQGKGIAEFLHGEMDREKFIAALKDCRFATEEDQPFFNSLEGTNWLKTHPWLSRDAGSNVLRYVQDDGARLLRDSRDFKTDTSGFQCEYHYLIDMDAETVVMNGGTPIPFAEWTYEKMIALEKRDEE